MNLDNIPPVYHNLSKVFSNLYPTLHCPYNTVVKLLPGAVPPHGRLFSLSPEEDGGIHYITEALQQGCIQPSTSPATAGFFFVKKMDGGFAMHQLLGFEQGHH